MRILFVDCCIKEGEASKTRQLCRIFLQKAKEAHPEYELETLVLKEEGLAPLLEAEVEQRDRLLMVGTLDHVMFDYARQFAAADRILIGAPYWDLSFPSLLKIYIEHIFVNGIAFAYEGPKSVGLCRAKKLAYIQTAGGFIMENEPGSVYLKAVCDMLGIPEFAHICAEGMDIVEIDRDRQWQSAIERAVQTACEW